MSSSTTRKSSGWLMPVATGVALIAALMIGLSMMRKMSPSAAPSSGAIAPPALQARPAGDAAPAPATDAVGGVRPIEAAPALATVGGPTDEWVQKARQLTSATDWPALERHALAWTQSQPNRVEAWQTLGVARSRLGKVDEAIFALKRVMDAEPANNNARVLLADAYLDGERWTEAADSYKQLVAALPNNPQLWNNYGVVLGRAGQSAQAVAALETAVRLDPSFRDAWNNLGQSYKAMGDSGRSAAAFAQANALR